MTNDNQNAMQDLLATEQWLEVDAAQCVLAAGSDAPKVGYLLDGMLKGVVYPRFGHIRSAVLNVVGDRHWFGIEAIATGHNIEYVSLVSSRYYLFGLDWFEQAPPPVVRAILHDVSWEYARYMPVNYINKLTLRQRVLSKLCDLREASSLPEIHITHEDLASLVGVHRNKIGAVLKDLEAEGLVEAHYREILLGSHEELLRSYRESHRPRSG